MKKNMFLDNPHGSIHLPLILSVLQGKTYRRMRQALTTSGVPVSFLFCVLISFLAIFSGCGKNQTTGGVFGGATGAVIGAAVAGPHDSGTGAAIGALAGSLLGSSVGQAADEEEAEGQTAVREMHHRQREAQLEEENRRLRDKWCVGCGNHVTLEGAKSCPQCGGELIREKYCPTCTTLFSPRTGYRFCPYCKQQTRLVGR